MTQPPSAGVAGSARTTETLGDPTLYRPLTVFTYAIDYAVWGRGSAAGFHATEPLAAYRRIDVGPRSIIESSRSWMVPTVSEKLLVSNVPPSSTMLLTSGMM